MTRHDFKFCDCGTVFVDGGEDYLRVGAEDLVYNPPKTIQVKIDDKHSGYISESDLEDYEYKFLNDP